MKNNIEVELRYFVNNKKTIQEKIKCLGGVLVGKKHIVDHWYIPKNIKSRKAHDYWFDIKRGAGIRIREDKLFKKTTLEIKKLTKEKNHNTFIESEIKIDSYENAHKFLTLLGRKKFLIIDKTRITYKLESFNIDIDIIKNYKTGLEIEALGYTSREKALKDIQTLATKLGLKKSDLAKKSITVSAMDTLAKFD